MGHGAMSRAIAAVTLAAVLGLSLALARGAQAQQGTRPESFTLAPGGSATITFEGFCYQFGEPFPDALTGPTGLAEGNIRSALALARDQGLIGSDADALQVQYAIWQLQGQADAPAGGELTQRILNQTRAAPGPASPAGTSLLDAVSSGQVSATVSEFAPVGQPLEIAPGVSDNFYGRGQLVVTNNTQETLELYMPIGTLMAAADPGAQDLVAYATAIESGDPAAAQVPTTAATEAATAAATEAATAAPTAAATEAATAAPTAAATEAATAAPTAAATEAATAAPAATSAATSAATAAPAATQAASPVAQQQQAPTFIEPAQPAASQLPATSGGGLPVLAIALAALGACIYGTRRWLRTVR